VYAVVRNAAASGGGSASATTPAAGAELSIDDPAAITALVQRGFATANLSLRVL
jgi:hypothetical protein